MSKFNWKEGIRIEDCPPGKAPHYPGKRNKNNTRGSDLSKSDFIDKVIEDWILYFDNKEKYEKTSWSNKTKYLVRYLEPLKVARSLAETKLIEIETRLATEAESNELKNSQDILCSDMEIDKEVATDHTQPGRSRWDKYKLVEKTLELNDEELFKGNTEISEDVKTSLRYKQREKAYYLNMPGKELFENHHNISTYTKKSSEFQEKQQQYVDDYMEDNFSQSSSQEILEKLSETPTCVQNSDALKTRLCHLSFEQRSERLVMKNIRDTLTELQKTAEGKEQGKIIVAAVSHPVYGDPGLDLSSRQKADCKKSKENLLTGKTAKLKLPDKKKRQIYPKSVENIAKEHWLETTIPEPAKHTGKAIEEGGETVPTRYQDKTDKECYENFKEECEEKVKMEMTKVSQEMILKLSKRPDTVDKERRLEYAQSLPDKFPGPDWYIGQRPPETKPLCDHTTGLCHVCESAKENFSSIVQAVKRLCRCGTKDCPRWFCACPISADGEDETPCLCPPCECEVCVTCKVSSFD